VYKLKLSFEEKFKIDSTYVLMNENPNFGELTFFGVNGLTNIVHQIYNGRKIIYQKGENGTSKEIANTTGMFVFGTEKWNLNQNNSSENIQKDIKFNYVSTVVPFLLHRFFNVSKI